MSDSRSELLKKIFNSDLIVLDHAVVTLCKSLQTILTTCPELADIDAQTFQTPSEDEEVILRSIMKPRLVFARNIKQLYNMGKFPLASLAADAVNNQPINSIPPEVGLFNVSLPESVQPNLSTVVSSKRKKSNKRNYRSISDDDESDGAQTKKGTKKWPPPLPQIEDKDLERQVFTHKSVTGDLNYMDSKEILTVHNERLEFLGDAVLNFTVGSLVYRHFPDAAEGELTKVRSLLVCNDTLAKWSAIYGLDQRLQTSMPLAQTVHDGGIKNKIFADVFEAYVGGLMTDEQDGSEVVRSWIADLIEPYVEKIKQERQEAEPVNKMAKNMLYAMIGTHDIGPEYITTVEGANGTPFKVECRFQGRVIGVGTGINTKIAGLRAAMDALKHKRLVDELSDARRKANHVASAVNPFMNNPANSKAPSPAASPIPLPKKLSGGPKNILYSIVGSATHRPEYKTEAIAGGYHTVVYVRGDRLGKGQGKTKKESENAAAEDTVNNHQEQLAQYAEARNIKSR